MVYVTKQFESFCGEGIFTVERLGKIRVTQTIQYFHNLYNLTVTIDIIDHK
jgi:hypothetical protein